LPRSQPVISDEPSEKSKLLFQLFIFRLGLFKNQIVGPIKKVGSHFNRDTSLPWRISRPLRHEEFAGPYHWEIFSQLRSLIFLYNDSYNIKKKTLGLYFAFLRRKKLLVRPNFPALF
jgi:hypothetical protein